MRRVEVGNILLTSKTHCVNNLSLTIDIDKSLDAKNPDISLGVMKLVTENLLAHPFIVLRRQCQVLKILNAFIHFNELIFYSLSQVNVFSSKYHLTPFTLIPIVIRLHQRQSMTVLFKGIGSALIVKGITLAIEDLLSKFTPWPKLVLFINQKFQCLLYFCLSC